MNIYFACSITGGREFEAVYQTIVRALLEDGHEVPTASLADAGVAAVEAVIDPRHIYERDIAWIRACDVLIAEVSVPSHGVGYEIGFSLGLGKPVLALYQVDRNVSKMIRGNPHPNLVVDCYDSPAQAVQRVRNFLNPHKLCL